MLCGPKYAGKKCLLEIWCNLLMTPVGTPMNPSMMYKQSKSDGQNVGVHDKAMQLQDLTVVSRETVVYGRIIGATAIGVMISNVGGETSVFDMLKTYAQSSWACHRVYGSIIVMEWAKTWKSGCGEDLYGGSKSVQALSGLMLDMLKFGDQGATLFYEELKPHLGRVRLDCQTLFSVFGEYGVVGLPDIPPLPSRDTAPVAGPFGAEFNIVLAEQITTEYYTQIIASVVNGPSMMPNKAQPNPPYKHDLLKIRAGTITASIAIFNAEKQSIDARVLGNVATCIVALDGAMPEKISPVVRSLMNAIQYEAHEGFQARVAEGIACLVKWNMRSKGGANGKIVGKLAGFLCCDLGVVGDVSKSVDGIVTLVEMQKVEDEKKGKGRPAKKNLAKLGADTAQIIDDADVVDEEAKGANDMRRRGAQMALKEIFTLFGGSAIESIPKLGEVMFAKIEETGDDTQELVNTMYVLVTCASFLDAGLYESLERVMKAVCLTLKHPMAVVRNAGAKCIAALTKVVTVAAMQVIVDELMPLLSDSRNLVHRQGAAEGVYHIIAYLDDEILPYIIFLIVPILGRMSDPDEGVRFLSTHIFAQLIKLVPLESGVPDPVGISKELIDQRKEERKFLGQLVGSEKVEDFEIGVEIQAELRPYQKEGVSWLAFLNRFGLHGILCDGLC